MSGEGSRPAPAFYLVVHDGPVGVGDEVRVAAVPAAGGAVDWAVGTVTGVDGDQGRPGPAPRGSESQEHHPRG